MDWSSREHLNPEPWIFPRIMGGFRFQFSLKRIHALSTVIPIMMDKEIMTPTRNNI